MRQELKLLLDENIGLRTYNELKARGYHVQSILVRREELPTPRLLLKLSSKVKLS